MYLGNHIITCLIIVIYVQGYEANTEQMRQKIPPAHAIDVHVNTIKTWVDRQDQDKYCFGLIVESASIEPGKLAIMRETML